LSKTERDRLNSQNREKFMEELRQSNPTRYREIREQQYQSQMANDYLKNNFSTEIDLDRVKYQSNGNNLFWPEYIKNNKTKIIIHHTASDNTFLFTRQDVLDYLSGVYRYHAITNGW